MKTSIGLWFGSQMKSDLRSTLGIPSFTVYLVQVLGWFLVGFFVLGILTIAEWGDKLFSNGWGAFLLVVCSGISGLAVLSLAKRLASTPTKSTNSTNIVPSTEGDTDEWPTWGADGQESVAPTLEENRELLRRENPQFSAVLDGLDQTLRESEKSKVAILNARVAAAERRKLEARQRSDERLEDPEWCGFLDQVRIALAETQQQNTFDYEDLRAVKGISDENIEDVYDDMMRERLLVRADGDGIRYQVNWAFESLRTEKFDRAKNWERHLLENWRKIWDHHGLEPFTIDDVERIGNTFDEANELVTILKERGNLRTIALKTFELINPPPE